MIAILFMLMSTVLIVLQGFLLILTPAGPSARQITKATRKATRKEEKRELARTESMRQINAEWAEAQARKQAGKKFWQA